MRDWLCFSSTDLLSWTPHGPLLRVEDFAWARDGAKASCVVARHGKFWWYLAMNHATVPGGAIGVAVADHPTGPFRDAIGAALVTNDVPDDDGGDHADHTNRPVRPRARRPGVPVLGQGPVLLGPAGRLDDRPRRAGHRDRAAGVRGGRPRPPPRRLVLPVLRPPVPAARGLRPQPLAGGPVDGGGPGQRGAGQLRDQPGGDRRVRRRVVLLLPRRHGAGRGTRGGARSASTASTTTTTDASRGCT